jgi:hypothetical protein
MRAVAALALVSCLLVAGCGGSGGSSSTSGEAAGASTLEQLWRDAKQNVAIVPGDQNHEPGSIRVSFLVVDPKGRVVDAPGARVWVAHALDAAPFVTTRASRERIGVPGGAVADATTMYVVHFRAAKPGKYWLLADPVDAKPSVRAIGTVVVSKNDPPPDVGDPAPVSATPTLASAGGDAASITTRTPPDTALLRTSVAQALRARVPFVVTFATPKFCTSRVCGPVVDVELAAAKRFRRSGVRFIHVEVYEGNDPAHGFNRWMKQWQLESEPWTFLVGSDGRIAERFEGAVSLRELERAIRTELLAR